jgi:hypothetical protein
VNGNIFSIPSVIPDVIPSVPAALFGFCLCIYSSVSYNRIGSSSKGGFFKLFHPFHKVSRSMFPLLFFVPLFSKKNLYARLSSRQGCYGIIVRCIAVGQSHFLDLAIFESENKILHLWGFPFHVI